MVLFYHIEYPPSTVNTPPVAYEEASDAKNTAIPPSSSGILGRPIGRHIHPTIAQTASLLKEGTC
jgi:hypothetical protein